MNDYRGRGTPRCTDHYISDYYTKEKHQSHCRGDVWAERVHLHKPVQDWEIVPVSPGSECFYIINPNKPELCWRYLSAQEACDEKYLKLVGADATEGLRQWRFIGDIQESVSGLPSPSPSPSPSPAPSSSGSCQDTCDAPTTDEFTKLQGIVDSLGSSLKEIQDVLQGEVPALSTKLDNLEKQVAAMPICSCPTPTPTPTPTPSPSPSPSPSPNPSPSPSPDPPTPPSKPQSVSIISSQSGSLTIGWTDGTPAGNPQEYYKAFCVNAGGSCSDTPVGIPATGLPKFNINHEIKGLNKATTYDCFVVAYNSVGEVCSDKATGTTKTTITEYGTPEGIVLYKTSQNEYVAWIKDYNMKVTPNPSRLTYCTVNKATWQFLGCSYFYNSDLRGPSGVVIYQPPTGSPQDKPLVISVQAGTGNTFTCVLDEKYGIDYVSGPNNLNQPGARDIALYKPSGGSTTYAYVSDNYGGSAYKEIVKYPLDSFGGNGGKIVTQGAATKGDIWGMYVDESNHRLYYVVAGGTDTSYVCALSTSNGDVTSCQQAYPSGTPYLDVPKDILIDSTSTYAYISDQKGIMLCDVNSADGKLTNPRTTGSGFNQPYGMEITPDNTKMYVVSTTGGPGEAGGYVSLCSINGDGTLSSCTIM